MKGTWGLHGLFAGACLLGLVAQVPASAADIIVDTADEKRTYDCQGGAAVINGGNNVLTLRNCTEVTVNGGDNLVDAGTARAINVLGSGNRVNYTMVEGRGKPKVVNLGKQNEVGTIGAPKPDVTSDDTPRADGSRIEAKGGRATVTGDKGIVILESGRRDTLDCAGGTASVVGSNNTLTLRNCTEVTITGNDNEVDVGDARTLSVHGNQNEVTWIEGPEGRRPTVSQVGKHNVVKRRR